MAYPQKRGKVWYAYVTMPPDADHAKPWVKSFSKDPETGAKWPTKSATVNWAREYEIEVNKPKLPAPRTPEKIDITWDQLWERWNPHGDGDLRTKVDDRTADFYRDNYQTHIGPKYGPTFIRETELGEVGAWLDALREGTVETGPEGRKRTRRYMPRTTDGLRKQMKLMLGDARVKGRGLIETDPLDEGVSRNRGRRVDRVQPETRPKVHVTPTQTLAIAVNMHQLVGPGTAAGIGAFLRVLTAGFAALRPGETSALAEQGCLIAGNAPKIIVDDKEGNLEERSGHAAKLKAPKSGTGRECAVPLGLAALLLAWFEYRRRVSPPPSAQSMIPITFPTCEAKRWDRRTWNRRWERAVGGGIVTLRASNGYVIAGEYVLERGAPGLEFKGLRRAWNVWATERGIPEVSRVHQLGHAMSDDMQEAYSLMSEALEAHVRETMQAAWVEAFRGYAGVEALRIIGQFSPTAAEANRIQIASARLALPPAGSGF